MEKNLYWGLWYVSDALGMWDSLHSTTVGGGLDIGVEIEATFWIKNFVSSLEKLLLSQGYNFTQDCTYF